MIQKKRLCVTQFQFFMCPFQSITVFQCVTGTQPPISQPDATKHSSNAFSPLRTGLDKCYLPHFQCKSTTSKCKTMLRLTETEHISFAPVMPTVLLPTLRHFSHTFNTNFVVPNRKYYSTDHGSA